MANKSETYIKNAVIAAPRVNLPAGNAPVRYKDQEKSYLAERAKLFASERAYLATDYVSARVQGIDENDFYKWTETTLRFADIASRTAASTRDTDDYKQILFDDLRIDYFPLGAKVETMGSTWIAINPANMSTALTDSIIQRCNVSYNSYDWYGNVITEPIIVSHAYMLGNSNDPAKNLVMMDGSFDVTCQLNENTKALGQTKRMILGTKAYHITGYTDFIQEFSGDRNSVHLLKFTARIEEPTINDDMVNFIADGNVRSFAAEVVGAENVVTGQSAVFTASFVKDGNATAGTEEKPITWTWESSDESVATVDENGVVTGVGAGEAIITARMTQNPTLYANRGISVSESVGNNFVAFSDVLSREIKQYTADIYVAAYYDNAIKTDEPLTWEFSGAEKGTYAAVVDDDGLEANVYCIKPSDTPLIIKASHGEYSATVKVELLGY